MVPVLTHASGKGFLPLLSHIHTCMLNHLLHRPRSAAAAEVLWSGRYDNDGQKRSIGDAMPRIFDWRYRLLKRGIQAEALQPLWW